MAIIRQAVAPSGASISYHEFYRMAMGADGAASIYVRSYASPELAASGAPVAWMWELAAPELSGIGLSPLDIELSLVSDSSSPFFGGSVSSDMERVGDDLLPPRPSEHHRFNRATKQWEDPRTLDDLKAAKNAAIDLARERANSSTFMFQGRTIAVDRLSKDDIMGAHGEWVSGQAPEGWPGGWKTKDKGPNGEPIYVPIPDQATWMAFYRAMVAQGTANFNHSQALKAQLAAATTPAEVEAVPDW